MLRGAILGLGNVAVHGHLPGWLAHDHIEIVAAADARPAQRGELTARLPRARWYDSAAELLAREQLDFVDICTPPASHAELIGAALGRGLHVLCEKPLVCSLDDLESVRRLASATGRVLHTVHNWHHAPVIRRIQDLLDRGEIGRVTRVVWQTLRTKPAAPADGSNGNWRVDPDVAGGGVLVDHGWHVFYLVLGWLGGPPTSIGATLETRRHKRWAVEDTAQIRLAFPDATAEIFLTWAADRRENTLTLLGTRGTIRVEGDTLVLARAGPDRGEQRWLCPPPLSDGSHHPDWFHGVAGEFVDEVREAAPRGVNLREASVCAVLLTLAQESSRHGGQTCPVRIPPPPASSAKLA